MNRRRGLVTAALTCAAAAALVLFGASRVWGEVVTDRVAPLPSTRTTRTGSDVSPWLPALAAVALAGAGALFATRGALRLAVGGLLVLCGAGIAVAALLPLSDGARPAWPVVCAVAAVAVAVAGGLTVRFGRSWPFLGTRYERATPPVPKSATRSEPATQAELWDALDRGEDPTK